MANLNSIFINAFRGISDLNIDELFKTYTTRIGSRLAGNYRFLRFFRWWFTIKKRKKGVIMKW